MDFFGLLHGDSIKRDYDWWRYWPRRGSQLGSLARIFVVLGSTPEGEHRELRLAFGRAGGSDVMEIIDERHQARDRNARGQHTRKR